MAGGVCAMGNAIVDILAHVDDAFLVAHDMRKGGMQLVDPEVIDRLRSEFSQSRECSGGSVANSVAALAQLGVSSSFIGRVADDALGQVFRDDIMRVGVTYRTPIAADGKPTASCCICVTPDGERTMNTYIGASAQVTQNDVDDQLVADADILYVEGYLWDQPDAINAIRHAVKHAKVHGTKVAFSASDTFCVMGHRDEFLTFIADDVDILFCNQDEAEALYPDMAVEEIARMLATQLSYCAVTCGGDVAWVGHNGAVQSIAPAAVSHVEDATGAGDMFAAGFMYGILRGDDIADATRIAHHLAGHIISQLGARSARDLRDVLSDKAAA